MKTRFVLVPLVLIASACGAPAPRQSPLPVAGDAGATPPATVTVDAAAPAPAADVFTLGVGEAIVLDGAPVMANDNPSSNALDYRMTVSGKVVVIGRSPGDATFRLLGNGSGEETRRFRVVADLCRPKPLHPALVMEVEDRAEVPVAKIREVEALIHSPWPASAHVSQKGFFVDASTPGHTTIQATTTDRELLLYDVFIGPTCANEHYAPVVAAVPPGDVGPKGDGTCVRRAKGRESPAPCPDRSRLEALPDPDLSTLACEWLASCDRHGFEGCCVGCTNPFAMKVNRTCAIKTLRARTCADVQKLFDAKGCRH